MKPNSLIALNLRIEELEAIRAIQHKELGFQIQSVMDNLKPFNIIKTAIHDVMELPNMKGGIGNLAIGSITGILAKKILWGNSINPVRSILGIITQTLVTNVATNNADDIRDKGSNLIQPLIQRFFQYRKMKRAELENNN